MAVVTKTHVGFGLSLISMKINYILPSRLLLLGLTVNLSFSQSESLKFIFPEIFRVELQ